MKQWQDRGIKTVGKIVHLKGTRIAPKALLAQVAEDMPDQVVVMRLRNNEWDASWSEMTLAELVYAHRILGLKIDDYIDGREPAP
jgi:hypothetical protein